MADYGVNIAVAVKNTQAVTKLSRDTDLLGQKIRNVNDALEKFGDLNGKTVVNSVKNFNKELAKAAENFNEVKLGSDRAADAARNFARAQDLANEALREQAALLAQVRNEGRSGTLRGGTQYSGPIGPGQASPTALSSPMRPQSLLFGGRSVDITGLNERNLAIQRDNLILEKAFFDLERKQADRLNDQLRLRKSINGELAQEAANVQAVIDKARQRQEFLQGKSGALQRPLAAAGSFGFPVALSQTKQERAAAAAAEGRKSVMEQLAVMNQIDEQLDKQRKIGLAITAEERKQARARQESLALQQREERTERKIQAAIERGTKAQERRQKLRSAAGSGIIGGAFPALFGQGVGASIGGGFGGLAGGLIGGEFGFGLSLVGTALGQAIDDARTFNESLNQLNANFQVTGGSAQLFGRDIDEIARLLKITNEEAVNAAKAFSFIADEKLTKAATKIFGTDTAGFGAFMGIEDAKSLSNAVGQIFDRNKDVAESLRDQLFVNGQLLKIDEARIKVLEAFIKLRFGSLTKEVDITVPGGMGTQNVIGRETVSQIPPETQEALAALGEAKRALMESISPEDPKADPTLGLQKRLGVLKAQVAAAQQIAELEGTAAGAARIQLKFSTAIAKAVERAKQDRAKTNDAQDIQIINETEIAAKQLASLEFERQALQLGQQALEQTKNLARPIQRQLDAIKDKAAFEREYGELIRAGVIPVTARQTVEISKQVKEIERMGERQEDEFDLHILNLEALKAGAKTLDLKEKIQAKINELLERRLKLEGKVVEAQEAAKNAAKTDSDRLQAEIDRVQGALSDLLNPTNQVILAAQAIGDAFAESFKGLITGSMSAQEALANLFQRTADHFADMAAQMIAKQIQMKILGIALNFFQPTASAGAFSRAPSDAAISAAAKVFSQPAEPFRLGAFAEGGYAQGGYVSGPTRALIGEGGQPEYVIPASKMTEAMGRYARGARGAAVIPEGDGMSTEGGMNGVSGVVDVRYSVERINNVDYVTAAEFERGMNQAAKRGAELGRQGVYSDLVNKRSIRSRVGV